jgi:hypothetical protein
VPHACTASCLLLPASNMSSSSSHLCCMAAAVQLLLPLQPAKLNRGSLCQFTGAAAKC